MVNYLKIYIISLKMKHISIKQMKFLKIQQKNSKQSILQIGLLKHIGELPEIKIC